MEKLDIRNHLESQHDPQTLIDHYKDLVLNKVLRDNNEEYIDMVADVIIEKIYWITLNPWN